MLVRVARLTFLPLSRRKTSAKIELRVRPQRFEPRHPDDLAISRTPGEDQDRRYDQSRTENGIRRYLFSSQSGQSSTSKPKVKAEVIDTGSDADETEVGAEPHLASQLSVTEDNIKKEPTDGIKTETSGFPRHANLKGAANDPIIVASSPPADADTPSGTDLQRSS